MQTVCVFCGASSGNRDSYRIGAEALGQAIAEQGLTLIYGGGKVGLMGAVADACLKAGGKVIGVIPEFLTQKEIAHAGLTELLVVDSMHTRKAKMAELSDGFIALPGGFGTMEEFFEILTWSQLGLHRKPHGLLNLDGFYDSLIHFFNHTVSEGFVNGRHRNLVVESDDPSELLHKLLHFQADVPDRWSKLPNDPAKL